MSANGPYGDEDVWDWFLQRGPRTVHLTFEQRAKVLRELTEQALEVTCAPNPDGGEFWLVHTCVQISDDEALVVAASFRSGHPEWSHITANLTMPRRRRVDIDAARERAAENAALPSSWTEPYRKELR